MRRTDHDGLFKELLRTFFVEFVAAFLPNMAQYQETTMQLMPSMRREGIQEGKESIIVRLMSRRFGPISPEVIKRLDNLSSDELDALTDNLLDFNSIADLEFWLSRHQSK